MDVQRRPGDRAGRLALADQYRNSPALVDTVEPKRHFHLASTPASFSRDRTSTTETGTAHQPRPALRCSRSSHGSTAEPKYASHHAPPRIAAAMRAAYSCSRSFRVAIGVRAARSTVSALIVEVRTAPPRRCSPWQGDRCLDRLGARDQVSILHDGDIVLDFCGLRLLAAAGLRVLLTCTIVGPSRNAGCLSAPSPSVQRVLVVAELAHTLSMTATLDDAVALITAAPTRGGLADPRNATDGQYVHSHLPAAVPGGCGTSAETPERADLAGLQESPVGVRRRRCRRCERLVGFFHQSPTRLGRRGRRGPREGAETLPPRRHGRSPAPRAGAVVVRAAGAGAAGRRTGRRRRVDRVAEDRHPGAGGGGLVVADVDGPARPVERGDRRRGGIVDVDEARDALVGDQLARAAARPSPPRGSPRCPTRRTGRSARPPTPAARPPRTPAPVPRPGRPQGHVLVAGSEPSW